MSYLEKPATPEEALAHFGVKGMRWGVRKRPNSGFSDDQRAAEDHGSDHDRRKGRIAGRDLSS